MKIDRRKFIAGATVAVCATALAATCGAAEEKEGEKGICQNREKNKQNCPCKNVKCPNFGICCQCVANHRAQKNKPACFR